MMLSILSLLISAATLWGVQDLPRITTNDSAIIKYNLVLPARVLTATRLADERWGINTEFNHDPKYFPAYEIWLNGNMLMRSSGYFRGRVNAANLVTIKQYLDGDIVRYWRFGDMPNTQYPVGPTYIAELGQYHCEAYKSIAGGNSPCGLPTNGGEVSIINHGNCLSGVSCAWLMEAAHVEAECLPSRWELWINSNEIFAEGEGFYEGMLFVPCNLDVMLIVYDNQSRVMRNYYLWCQPCEIQKK